MRVPKLILFLAALALLVSAPAAVASKKAHRKSTAASPVATDAGSGGASFNVPAAAPSSASHPTVPGWRGRIIRGVAYAPAYAPIEVKKAIWAGNRIRHKPYIWGGGHGSFNDSGYDCSGAVSYVLHAAGLLDTPMASGDLMSWGRGGVGHWITVYTNPSHAFVQIAGIRLDTSREADPNPPSGSGPRWRPVFHGYPQGFDARHPGGF